MLKDIQIFGLLNPLMDQEESEFNCSIATKKLKK